MNEVWVLAETRNGRVAPVSFELVSWARSLGTANDLRVTAVLAGPASDPEELCYRGADAVLHGSDPELGGHSARPLARFLSSLLRRPRPAAFLAAATTTGRTAFPYLAARERLGLTADCTGLELDSATGELLQTRPAAGGNIMATIKTARGRPQLATVRPHSRKALERDPSRPVRVEPAPVPPGDGRDGATLVEDRPFPSSRGLADARVVVSGGKGLKRKDGFKLLEELASRIGAEVGASREAVDRGWAEYPRQVGLSGRTVSPALYLAFGISGAIQHLAGMQTSELVVSVNADPDAPIVSMSDLAIRGDLYELLPVLAAKLEGYRPAGGSDERAL